MLSVVGDSKKASQQFSTSALERQDLSCTYLELESVIHTYIHTYIHTLQFLSLGLNRGVNRQKLGEL